MSGPASAAERVLDEAIWHDVECAGYEADFELWGELADAAGGGRILDLGCGTGRIALRLAAEGHDVVALDSDAALVDKLARRARRDGLHVETVTGDARSFTFARGFALVIAPMQVIQLMGGAAGRAGVLRCAFDTLEPGGRFAAALADPFEAVEVEEALPPLPDLREEDGWVYSSTPVAMHSDRDAMLIERVRQAVSPTGELAESVSRTRLDELRAEQLEAEGRSAGYAVAPRLAVPPTRDYVGSAVVILEKRLR